MMKKDVLYLDNLTMLSENELLTINGGEDTPAQNGYDDGHAVGEAIGKFLGGLGALVLIFAL